MPARCAFEACEVTNVFIAGDCWVQIPKSLHIDTVFVILHKLVG